MQSFSASLGATASSKMGGEYQSAAAIVAASSCIARHLVEAGRPLTSGKVHCQRHAMSALRHKRPPAFLPAPTVEQPAPADSAALKFHDQLSTSDSTHTAARQPQWHELQIDVGPGESLPTNPVEIAGSTRQVWCDAAICKRPRFISRIARLAGVVVRELSKAWESSLAVLSAACRGSDLRAQRGFMSGSRCGSGGGLNA